jgi:SAM-dependent methyltransferase
VRRGEVSEGLALLDEAMVAVLSDNLLPEFAGNIYCHLMDVFDYHEESIDTARKSAAQAGVSDRVTFEVAQASAFPGTYDLVCTFDAFHDMGDPVGVASHVRKALAPGGTWMIVELNASGDLLDNINPLGRFLYSASSFVCVPNALSQSDTEALGAAAGKEGLEAVVRQAGFTRSAAVAESLFNLVLEVRA